MPNDGLGLASAVLLPRPRHVTGEAVVLDTHESTAAASLKFADTISVQESVHTAGAARQQDAAASAAAAAAAGLPDFAGMTDSERAEYSQHYSARGTPLPAPLVAAIQSSARGGGNDGSAASRAAAAAAAAASGASPAAQQSGGSDGGGGVGGGSLKTAHLHGSMARPAGAAAGSSSVAGAGMRAGGKAAQHHGLTVDECAYFH